MGCQIRRQAEHGAAHSLAAFLEAAELIPRLAAANVQPFFEKETVTLVRTDTQTDGQTGQRKLNPPCTRMYTHLFFEATPPGAALGPPVENRGPCSSLPGVSSTRGLRPPAAALHEGPAAAVCGGDRMPPCGRVPHSRAPHSRAPHSRAPHSRALWGVFVVHGARMFACRTHERRTHERSGTS